jgi:hypothetical protein
MKKYIMKPHTTSLSTIDLIQQRLKIHSQNDRIKELMPNFNIQDLYNNNDLKRVHFANLFTVLMMITEQY